MTLAVALEIAILLWLLVSLGWLIVLVRALGKTLEERAPVPTPAAPPPPNPLAALEEIETVLEARRSIA